MNICFTFGQRESVIPNCIPTVSIFKLNPKFVSTLCWFLFLARIRITDFGRNAEVVSFNTLLCIFLSWIFIVTTLAQNPFNLSKICCHISFQYRFHSQRTLNDPVCQRISSTCPPTSTTTSSTTSSAERTRSAYPSVIERNSRFQFLQICNS